MASPAPEMSNPRKQVMVGMGALVAAIGGYMYTKRWEVQGVAIPMYRKGLLAPSPSLNVYLLEKEDRPKREDLVKKESPLDTEDPKNKKDPSIGLSKKSPCCVHVASVCL